MEERRACLISSSRPDRRRRFLRLVVIGTLAGWCGLVPASRQAGAQTAALPRLKVTTELNVANSGFFIAMAKGYFKDAGVDIEMSTQNSPENNTLAVASGTVDVALAGVTAGFYNIAAKGGLRLIASSASERPGYHNVGFVATNAAFDAGLKSLKDLRGKRLSITTLGGPAHYGINLLAQKNGFPISDITIVPLQTVPNEVAALKGGQVDAMAASSPTPHLVEADGSGHIIGWLGDEATFQAGVVIARPAVIEDQRPLVEKFIQGYVHGTADYNAAFNTLDAAGNPVKGPGYDEILKIVSDAVHLPADRVVQGLPYIDPKGRLAIFDVENQIAFWKSQGYVDKSADMSKLIDQSFVKGQFLTPK